jgi:hypothetical protein
MEREEPNVAPPNGSAQVEGEASGDRRPEGLYDGARQLLGRAQDACRSRLEC